MQLGRAAETLRSQFQEEAIASHGVDDATGKRRRLEQLCVNPSFAQSEGADKAGNAATDHHCCDVTGHGDVSILAGSKSFRKERLGDELLFFEIWVENHCQIADENAAEPGGADFASFEKHEAILARWFQAAKLFREMLVKIDAKFA